MTSPSPNDPAAVAQNRRQANQGRPRSLSSCGFLGSVSSQASSTSSGSRRSIARWCVMGKAPGILASAWVVARKDLRIELRARDTLVPMLAFSFVVQASLSLRVRLP